MKSDTEAGDERINDDFEDLEELDVIESMLLEDEEEIRSLIELSEKIFRSPDKANLEDVHGAIECWDNIYTSLYDSNVSDRIGEIMGLLDELVRKNKLSFKDKLEGQKSIDAIDQFLIKIKRK